MKIDYDNLGYHPLSESLVDVMSAKTQNPNRGFFRTLVPYYWSLVAAAMHVKIEGFGDGKIPINYYGINLAPSGTGKGVSLGVMEREVLKGFKERFLSETFIETAKKNINIIAAKRAVRNGTDQKAELELVSKEFARLGAPLLWFDSATTPAIKQFRHKILLAGCGAVNFCIDEIGANLLGQLEPLMLYLELYDHGTSKEKLIKSTKDDQRAEIIEGATPTNLLMFGTQSKLLDGAKTESEFMAMLDMGYARRCFVGYVPNTTRKQGVTADDLYQQMTSVQTSSSIASLSNHLARLADPANVGTSVYIDEAEAKMILQYRLDCEKRGEQYTKDSDSVRKVEMDNRFFKTLKLAGAYAFIDGSPTILKEHVEYAIRLAEDSGAAFNILMTPERPYVKFAKHLAESSDIEFTLPDLEEDLAYFRGGRNQKDELIAMATAWGYKNAVIISKRFDQGILLIKGETLQKTTLNEMIISYSSDIATGYCSQRITWDNLKSLIAMKDMHYINHNLMPKNGITDINHPEYIGGVRSHENIIAGFNFIAIDVDSGLSLSMAQLLLRDYKYLMYTTKRHQIAGLGDRYRIIMPLNYELKLSDDDFKEFMNNLASFLPIPMDKQTFQPARKWSTTNNCQIFENDGILLDVMPHLPRTSKEEERKAFLKQYENLDNLERWFIDHTGSGNRNNQLYNYAAMLHQAGFDISDITSKTMSLNKKLPEPIPEAELMRTVVASVAKKTSV